VLQRLLAMADSYYHDGAINQAQEIYFDLITNHGDSVEAGLAEERLMALARLRELAGEPRAARAIYDRLLKLNS
jgi:TolA-binding protein